MSDTTMSLGTLLSVVSAGVGVWIGTLVWSLLHRRYPWMDL